MIESAPASGPTTSVCRAYEQAFATSRAISRLIGAKSFARYFAWNKNVPFLLPAMMSTLPSVFTSFSVI